MPETTLPPPNPKPGQVHCNEVAGFYSVWCGPETGWLPLVEADGSAWGFVQQEDQNSLRATLGEALKSSDQPHRLTAKGEALLDLLKREEESDR